MIEKWYLIRSTTNIHDDPWINCLIIKWIPKKQTMKRIYLSEHGMEFDSTNASIVDGVISFVADMQMNKTLRIIAVDYFTVFVARYGKTMDVHTEHSFDYQYFPLDNNFLLFEVKARNASKIALTFEPKSSKRMYEVYLSYGLSGHSLIRINHNFVDYRKKIDYVKDNPINEREFTGIWIRYNPDGYIAAGYEKKRKMFIYWIDPDPLHNISYFGISTLMTPGDWKFKEKYFVFSRCEYYRKEDEEQVNDFCQSNSEEMNWSYRMEDCPYYNNKTFMKFAEDW